MNVKPLLLHQLMPDVFPPPFSGKSCTMLSDQNTTREEAIYASLERFGKKVVNDE